MRCPDCGDRLRGGQTECPRCGWQRPPAVDQPARPRRGKALVALAMVGVLIVGGLLAHDRIRARRQERATQARLRAIFDPADGPCRNGVEVPCRDAIRKLRAMRDRSDASFLLGDLRVARYLRARPDGGVLARRWRRDQIGADELTALGNEALDKNLIVFRSFWMYANVKRQHFPVPGFIIPPPRFSR